MAQFEEYRQAWETGPHWELKREFLEYYKDKFPEDRLLCLAQAYSNIELLQCSYPNQVMYQIHELSKPLKGCKRFRRNENSKDRNAQEQQCKRKNESASSKKFKFIKFCSGSEDSSTAEIPESKSVPIPPSSSSVDIESIYNSPDFKVFKKLSEEVKKIMKISKENAYDIILSAALHSNVEDLIDLKFKNDPIPSTDSSLERYLCEVFIGTTKCGVGHGDNRYLAKIEASKNALHILTNLKEPSKRSEVVSHTETDKHSSALCRATPSYLSVNKSRSAASCSQPDSSPNARKKELLKKFALELKNSIIKSKSIEKAYNHTCILHNVAIKLNVLNYLDYKIKQETGKIRKNHPQYLCDLFLHDMLIGQGEASKMKFARREAGESGFKYLISLIEDGTEESQDSKANPISSPAEISKPFSLNKELLNNSFKEQFIIFDRSEFLPSTVINPASILAFSAQKCRKSYSYNFTTNEDGTFRAEVLLDDKVYGTGDGECKQTAKSEAAKNAFNILKNQVYTVKVKAGNEEGFEVKRSDMLDLSAVSEAVSNDNVGCKMLKMMGWSGGGIGKKQGIAEPIQAGSHNFGTGLGYGDASGQMDMRNLKSKMEVLLEGYAKSDAVAPLIFSLDFTKLERKAIHRIAEKFNLFNNSCGKGSDRQLFIRRKLSPKELLEWIVKAGGKTKKYELVEM